MESGSSTNEVNWALCFFEAGHDPMVVESRPPKEGSLATQCFALYIPCQDLSLFYRLVGVGPDCAFKHKEAHCKLNFFRRNAWDSWTQWVCTLRAHWTGSIHDEHFKFEPGQELLPYELVPGYYNIQCEFYNKNREGMGADAVYNVEFQVFELVTAEDMGYLGWPSGFPQAPW
ncbi:hypothetical protein GGR51DRAFT_560844 [Nemania sp. FL0031]|nr:hypothetical protein GGR51DRAFT_560844 [Nemania sp. FL0031]